MAKKYKPVEVGKVYPEAVTVSIRGKNNVIRRVHVKDTRDYQPAGTYTPKWASTPRVFYIKVVPAEQRAQAQWKSWMEEIPEEPEGKPDIVSLTLHFKNVQSGIKRSPSDMMFLEGWVQKFILRENVDREIEKLVWEVQEVIRNTQYYAIADYLTFGNEEVEDAEGADLTSAPYEVLKYQYKCGENGLLRRRTYEMGMRSRDG